MRVLILGGTLFIGAALRLSLIYGEHDGQRREEFVLRRVRAGRLRIPFGAGTSLDTRCYVGDVASAVLAALDNASVASGQWGVLADDRAVLRSAGNRRHRRGAPGHA